MNERKLHGFNHWKKTAENLIKSLISRIGFSIVIKILVHKFHHSEFNIKLFSVENKIVQLNQSVQTNQAEGRDLKKHYC